VSRRRHGHYRTEAARRRALANLRPGPKAKPGNDLAVRHGAYASIGAAELDSETAAVVDALSADAPLKEAGELPAADAVVVELLAACLIRLRRVTRFHLDRGWLTDADEPRPSVALESKLRREALDLAEALGMTPRSRARLGLDLARTEDVARGIAALDGEGGSGG
jgi:hypothetical protein